MADTDKKLTKAEPASAEAAKFKGRFTKTIGRRKTATARVRFYKGDGLIIINEIEAKKYFTEELFVIINQPF